jgi:hypothetical protein
MRNEEEIRLIAKRIRLVMGQKESVLHFYHDLEKLVDLILEEEGEHGIN